jgi:hypothetical protein
LPVAIVFRCFSKVATALEYKDKDHNLTPLNPDVVFNYTDADLSNGMIAP